MRIGRLLFLLVVVGVAVADDTAVIARLKGMAGPPGTVLAMALGLLPGEGAYPRVGVSGNLAVAVAEVPTDGGDAKRREALVRKAQQEALRPALQALAVAELRRQLAPGLDAKVRERAFLFAEVLREVLLAHQQGTWLNGTQVGPGQSQVVADVGDRAAVVVWCDRNGIADFRKALPPVTGVTAAYADRLVVLAEGLLAQKQPAEALAYLGNAIIHGRDDSTVNLMAAESLLAIKQRETASALALKIWQSQASQLDAAQAERLGDLLREVGQAAVAKQAYQRALELNARIAD